MKTRIAIIWMMLFCAGLSAQNNFHFTYDYNMQGDGGFKIIETQDKNLIAFGLVTSGAVKKRFLKVDSIGTEIFNKAYVATNDWLYMGGEWSYGYYGFGDHADFTEGAADSDLIFLDKNGDSLKLVTIDFEYNDRIHDAVLLHDSNFVVMGFYTDTAVTDQKPYVAKIDTLGNILWFKTHNTANNIMETVNNMQPTQDDGFVIGGIEEETPNGHTDLFLLKVDSSGNQEWKYKYNEPLSQRTGYVVACQNGDFALFGTGYHPQGAQRAMVRVDSAGNFKFRRKHGVLQYDEGYIAAKELPNGNFICAGTSIRNYQNQLIDDINLSMLDSAGNELWSRNYSYYGQDINSYAKDITLTADGGFAVTGFILNAPTNTRNDIFILKTDGNGLLTGIDNGFAEVEPALRVYPNPTKGQVTIPAIPEIEKIQLYDVSGKLVYTSTPLSVTSNHTVNIKGEKGLYFLQITKKDGSVSNAKIIKE